MKKEILIFLCVILTFVDCKEYKYKNDDINTWVIQIKNITQNDEQLNKFAESHGFSSIKEIKHLNDNYYIMKFDNKNNNKKRKIIKRLEKNENIIWFEEQKRSRRFTRVLNNNKIDITDPLYKNQWHLFTLNMEDVWSMGYTGNGVTIGVVDDGLQTNHPDLHHNYISEYSYDYNYNDEDPSPSFYDSHGTSVAGVCCSVKNNGVCGVGVAYNAKVAGIRLIAAPAYDYTESYGLSHKWDHIDIYSNSWGPADNAYDLAGPGRLTKSTLAIGVQSGRNGKGSIYVWAGGNGGGNNDNCNYDGFASSRFTIAVGAMDYNNVRSWYSEPCAALMVTAPSSGVYNKGIVTTDLIGNAGYSSGDCTAEFGGTSSATPVVSGAIALVLEANPSLTWRDVQHLIALTSMKVDFYNNDWSNENSRGYTHSHEYGFGLINPKKMVEKALNWVNVPIQKSCTSKHVFTNEPIPESSGGNGNGNGLVTTISMPRCNIDFVEHVELIVFLEHPTRGEVEISLTSPESCTSILSEVHDDINVNYPYLGWTFTSVRHWGERSSGEWKVMTNDPVVNNVRGISKWMILNIHGY